MGIFVLGHYVPQLSQAIVKHNSAKKEKAINLKGYMVLVSFISLVKIPGSCVSCDEIES